jgi:colicin import membrane protein
MRANSPSAVFLSLSLHGAVVAVVVLLTWYLRAHAPPAPVIFELVAGPPDGQQHLEAGGAEEPAEPAKVDFKALPALNLPAPAAEPVPAEPTPPAPVPAEAVPTPPVPVVPVATAIPVEAVKPKPRAKVESTVPNLTRTVKRAEKKVVTREMKKMEAEAKAREEKERRMSIEQFRQQQAKAAAGGGSGKTAGVRHVDAQGLADSLRGAAARTGAGEGGRALTREQQNELDTYISRLLQALRTAHNKPAGLSDLLNARVEFVIAADGRLSNVRIVHSSGNAEFDRSVIEAFAAVGSIGPTPDGKGDTWAITFKLTED